MALLIDERQVQQMHKYRGTVQFHNVNKLKNTKTSAHLKVYSNKYPSGNKKS